MFNFSSKTVVNKEYKVSDFLHQITATKEIKADAKIVKKIFFQNVINATSLNVDEDSKYVNIYVIRMLLAEERIPRLFVEAIDKSIFFHTYFLFEYEGNIASTVAYKEITKQVKVDKYYTHNFDMDKTIELDSINSVADVYKNILAYETGIAFRKSENPAEYISRAKEIKKLEYQMEKTEKAIQFETQPKKKFEYNKRLREYKAQYEELIKGED